MAVRLIEMHRVLKDTGSIYFHCDSTMSHYIKIMMDIIFGEENFRNEIVWCYHGPGSPYMKQFNRKSDTIFWYSKGDKWIFNKDSIRVPFKDPNQSLRKVMSVSGAFSEKEVIEYREKGKIPENWWEIRIAARSKKEYVGYPTQKPLKLLERIIKASSNEGDVVLDPFCGCATTCVAAEIFNRKWIGIDTSHKTYELVKERLKENLIDFKEGSIDYKTYPPTRTDGEQGQTEGKYVYIISNLHYENLYKVGVSNDVERRLNGYQTGCPNRAFKVEYKKYFSNYREVENEIHSKFKYKAEWVEGNLKEIIDFMEKL